MSGHFVDERLCVGMAPTIVGLGGRNLANFGRLATNFNASQWL